MSLQLSSKRHLLDNLAKHVAFQFAESLTDSLPEISDKMTTVFILIYY